MARAAGVKELLAKKFKSIDFTDEWLASFGEPAHNFKCIIWGNSGNGKTNLTIKMAKYLTQFGKVAYNSIEEGHSKTMQIAWQRHAMEDVTGKIVLLDREPIPELISRLKKSRAIKFVIIDSVQMAQMTRELYLELVKVARKRVGLIFISHATGKEPTGSVARDIRYDADIKVFVEGFKADVASRYGGNEPFIIWQQGAEEYWGASLYVKRSKRTAKQLKIQD